LFLLVNRPFERYHRNMKNSSSKNKVALVTGADRGIGFEICRQLAESGFSVILGSPDPAKGKTAAQRLKATGANVVYQPLDLLNNNDIAALLAFVIKTFGRLDVLVNNAGISLDLGMSRVEGLLARKLKKIPKKKDYGNGPGILGADLDILRATLEVNTLGALKMCQAFVPLMIKAGHGRVINISSTLGQLARMNDEDKVPAYQLSKTALNAVTRMMADAAKNGHVSVNSVCPGWTRTRLGGPDAPQSPRQAAKDIVWLAVQAKPSLTGKFFQHRKVIEW